MKKSNLFFGVILVVGIVIFLYPSISNYINSKHQSRAISGYESQLLNLTEADYDAFWQAAYAYNAKLAKQGAHFELSDAEMEEYNSLLDPTGTGIMGHIEITDLAVDLPIYHNIDEAVLQIGVGHLPGSSLPVGGNSTHTVLSGHRGLPSSKLFSDLDQMEEGDIFLLHIMNETLAYQVDQINIVLPEETGNLVITDGKDYCTLITCTPYGVNTHRLLIRGKRIDYEKAVHRMVTADATKYDALSVAPFIGIPLVALLLLALLVGKPRKKNTEQKSTEQKNTEQKETSKEEDRDLPNE